MGYQIAVDHQYLEIEGGFFSNKIIEKESSMEDEVFAMHLKDVSLRDVHLTWGVHRTAQPRELSIKFETPAIVSHFVLADSSFVKSRSNHSSVEKKFMIHHQEARTYAHEMAMTTKEEGYTFFELALSASFLDRFFIEEDRFSDSFYHQVYAEPGIDYANMNPAMLVVINEMAHNDYKGHFKSLYLEAKAIELFLLQLKELDQKTTRNTSKLRVQDIERLYEAKHYIELNYHTPCSIIDLARIVGINQMKLKNGFKELFGNTVFGFLRDLQMEKAKNLLLEEKLFVAEVADRVGYKHAHHFTVAFKRKFGMLPSDLKA